jgi:predicted O-methyltransferase YrrM
VEATPVKEMVRWRGFSLSGAPIAPAFAPCAIVAQVARPAEVCPLASSMMMAADRASDVRFRLTNGLGLVMPQAEPLAPLPLNCASQGQGVGENPAEFSYRATWLRVDCEISLGLCVIDLMNEVLRLILSTNSVVTDTGITRPLEGNIPEQEGAFIQEIIKQTQPKISVEIGLAYGISTLYICEALQEVNAIKHIVIDPIQNLPYGNLPYGGRDSPSGWEGVGLTNIRRAGYSDIVDFHDVPSYQYMAQLSAEHATIDFAFIDGAHNFDYVLVDVFLIDKLLKRGGIIILDDVSYPSIRSVCRYVLSNLRYKCIGPRVKQKTALSKRLASMVSSKMPLGKKIFSPKLTLPDWQLNLPSSNYVALQKLEDDVIGETAECTRHWADYTAF